MRRPHLQLGRTKKRHIDLNLGAYFGEFTRGGRYAGFPIYNTTGMYVGFGTDYEIKEWDDLIDE